MEALSIFDQPWAEWLGECYIPITPENMKETVCRINDHPDTPKVPMKDVPEQDNINPLNIQL